MRLILCGSSRLGSFTLCMSSSQVIGAVKLSITSLFWIKSILIGCSLVVLGGRMYQNQAGVNSPDSLETYSPICFSLE